MSHSSAFHGPYPEGTFRKTPETLSERFLDSHARVRLGSPKPYNSRHLKPPQHFHNFLPLSTAGDASFFRSGSGEGLSEPVMEFPAALGVFLIPGHTITRFTTTDSGKSCSGKPNKSDSRAGSRNWGVFSAFGFCLLENPGEFTQIGDLRQAAFCELSLFLFFSRNLVFVFFLGKSNPPQIQKTPPFRELAERLLTDIPRKLLQKSPLPTPNFPNY